VGRPGRFPAHDRRRAGRHPTVIFALSHSLTAGIVTAAAFIAYQQIENHVLNPVIMSRTVNVNPLLIQEPLIETIPDEVLAAVGRDLRQWEHFYTVKSDLVSGWVIGGSASGRQDQKSYSARTMFDGWVPGDEVIRLFEVNVS
jgi:hypothetical protein